MNKVIRKASLSTILLITILAITVTPAFATLGYWYYILFAVNISGNSDAFSGKMVCDTWGPYWSANIVTFTDYPPVDLNLGWNWFSGTEKCDYDYIQNVQGGARYITNDQTANTVYLYAQYCNGTRYGLSGGKHIATSPGGTNYYKIWTQTEIIP